ncbi:MAG: histidine phosphatase family protein [Actinomycetia bacterium]|nr:histidine phosphatase family protein [Actinomycetes bacterium]
MSTVLLVRHGRTALTGPVLAGRAPGVCLDQRGRAQAEAVAARLAALPLAAIVTSPLERCAQTAAIIAAAQAGARSAAQSGAPSAVQFGDGSAAWLGARVARSGNGSATQPGAQPGALAPVTDERLIECQYGAWTSRPVDELYREPLWRVVQAQPSAARFPDGESLPELSARAIAAVRDWDRRLGPDAVWVACSHGDVIKAVLADAVGAHLDQFQRIVVDPCSVSAVRYTRARPYLLRANDVGGSLAALAPPLGRADYEAEPGGDSALGADPELGGAHPGGAAYPGDDADATPGGGAGGGAL